MGQLDLYELLYPNDEIGTLRREIADLKDCLDNVRKGLFARHNTFLKMYLEQQETVSALKEAVDDLKSHVPWSEPLAKQA